MPQTRFKGRVPQLNRLYKVNDLAVAWLPWLTHPFDTVDLPTEKVILRPGIYTPLQARVYETELFIHPDGRLVDYVELASIPDFHGIGEHSSVMMAEVWEDYGDDGHVRPILLGWKFIDGKDFQEVHYAMIQSQRQSHPLSRFVSREESNGI